MKRAAVLLVIVFFTVALSACAGTSKGTEVGNPDPSTEVAQPSIRSISLGDIKVLYPEGCKPEMVSETKVRFVAEQAGASCDASVDVVSNGSSVPNLQLFEGVSLPGATFADYAVAGFDEGRIASSGTAETGLRVVILLRKENTVVIFEKNEKQGDAFVSADFSFAVQEVKSNGTTTHIDGPAINAGLNDTVTVTIGSYGAGKVHYGSTGEFTCDGEMESCDYSIPKNASVTLTAVHDDPAKLVLWVGECAPAEGLWSATVTFTVSKNMNCSALFQD